MLCSLAPEASTLGDGKQMMLLKKPEGRAVQLGMMVQFGFRMSLAAAVRAIWPHPNAAVPT